MPRLIQTESRTDTVVDAMNYLLALHGPGGLTLRAIARESRVSTSSLLHHYGSREHLVRVAANRTGRARIQAIERRSIREGVTAFLPVDSEDVVEARAWLGWWELWRVEDSLTSTVDRIRAEELMILARLLDLRFGTDELAVVVALIDGLTMAICEPVRPLSPGRACHILTAQLAGGAFQAGG